MGRPYHFNHILWWPIFQLRRTLIWGLNAPHTEAFSTTMFVDIVLDGSSLDYHLTPKWNDIFFIYILCFPKMGGSQRDHSIDHFKQYIAVFFLCCRVGCIGLPIMNWLESQHPFGISPSWIKARLVIMDYVFDPPIELELLFKSDVDYIWYLLYIFHPPSGLTWNSSEPAWAGGWNRTNSQSLRVQQARSRTGKPKELETPKDSEDFQDFHANMDHGHAPPCPPIARQNFTEDLQDGDAVADSVQVLVV